MTKDQFIEITEWQKRTFSESTSLSKISHLKQELEELITELKDESENRKLEFADCFLLLFGAASADGMSYEDICNCINDKMKINYQRNWGKPDSDGVVNHLKK